ncbi:unnamed protein product, partial [marine sediment metagenome]
MDEKELYNGFKPFHQPFFGSVFFAQWRHLNKVVENKSGQGRIQA